MAQDRLFTLDEARALLRTSILGAIEELIPLRAAMTGALADREQGTATVALADMKAMEARLAEILDGLRREGVQVKGWAPLLLDFRSLHDGREILLCWLEGERDLAWYHEAAHGFAGRRPLHELA